MQPYQKPPAGLFAPVPLVTAMPPSNDFVRYFLPTAHIGSTSFRSSLTVGLLLTLENIRLRYRALKNIEWALKQTNFEPRWPPYFSSMLSAKKFDTILHLEFQCPAESLTTNSSLALRFRDYFRSTDHHVPWNQTFLSHQPSPVMQNLEPFRSGVRLACGESIALPVLH